MAVVTENSVEYAVQVAGDGSRNHANLQHGKKRIAVFHHTQAAAGDVNSKINLCNLPFGPVRVLGVHVNSSAFGAARTLDIGHTGYTGMDGVAVVAAEDAFVSALDISGAVDSFKRAGGATAAGVFIQSKGGFTVQAKVEGDAIDIGETLNGWVEYVTD